MSQAIQIWSPAHSSSAAARGFLELDARCFAQPWKSAEGLGSLEGRTQHSVPPAGPTACIWFAGISPPEPLAYALFNVMGPEAELLRIGVLSGSRRQGIARCLLRASLDELRSCGVKEVFLEVGAANSGARNLYERLGFVTIAVRTGYYSTGGGGEDAVVQRLEL